MKTSFILFFGLLFSLTGSSQSKTDVEKAARDYIEGFYYGDTAKIYNSISPNVIKHGYEYSKEKNKYVGDTMTFRECVDYAAKVHKRGVSPNVEKYPKKIEVFDVLDKTASAKVTAWWGTDYLLLTKTNNRWLITHILWQSVPPAVPVEM